MIVYGDPSAIGPLKRFGAPLKRFGARHSAPRMQSNSERMAGCAVTVNTKGSNKHCTVKMSQSRIVLSVYCLACAWTADSRLRGLWQPIHPYITERAVGRWPSCQQPSSKPAAFLLACTVLFLWHNAARIHGITAAQKWWNAARITSGITPHYLTSSWAQISHPSCSQPWGKPS